MIRPLSRALALSAVIVAAGAAGSGTALAPAARAPRTAAPPGGAPVGRYLDLGRRAPAGPVDGRYHGAPRPWEREAPLGEAPPRDPGRYLDLGAMGRSRASASPTGG